jgi:hypothetical protein
MKTKTAAPHARTVPVRRPSIIARRSATIETGRALPVSHARIQPKLRVGAVDDPMEREADAVAQRVVSMPAPESVAADATPNGGTGDAGGTGGGDAVQPSRNRTAAAMGPRGGAAPSDVAAFVERPGAGRPLSAALRAFMQPRFDADFTNVRVHDAAADRAAASRIGARAFTLRHHIWLGPGESAEDGRLMAHELTHVTQQTRTERPAPAAPAERNRTARVPPARDGGAGNPGPKITRSVMRDMLGGFSRPLDDAAGAVTKTRFGEDFGGVRTHDDAQAAKVVSAIDARAYTMHNNIVFAPGERQAEPGCRLAHELTHVAQDAGMSTHAVARRPDGPALVRRRGTEAVLQRQEIEHGSGKSPEARARSSESAPQNTPFLRTKNKPLDAARYIVDLTKVAGVESELTKTTAKWLLVEVKGERWYIEVGEQRMAAILQDLKAHIVKDGTAQPTFEPTTFFNLDNNTLTFGTAGTETSLAVGVKEAGNVLEESNARTEDAAWSFLNAGQSALHKEDVKEPGERAGPQEKPGAWYNYYFIENGVVKAHLSPNDPRSKAAGRKGYQPPTMSLAAYREMLKQDFNFGGVVSQCNAAGAGAGGGEKAFVDAILARGNTNVGNSADLAALAREIWSYATTGADTSGKTDIAEMQGLLFALDARIQESSGTNTPMSSGTFTLRGTGVKLNLGDGRHGRATVLTTRHLLADIKVTARNSRGLETEPRKQGGVSWTPHESFLLDTTVSFGYPQRKRVLEEVARLLNLPPYEVKTEATFGEFNQTVKNTRSRRGRVDRQVKDWRAVLKDAYEYLYGKNPTMKDAVEYAGLFDLKFNEAFDSAGSGAHPSLDAEKLMIALGEPDVIYGAPGESGLKAVISTLLYNVRYEDRALGAKQPEQIDVLMDEGEQGLEYLELAKALARKKKHVQVRLLPVGPQSTAQDIPFIDLATLEITNTIDLRTESPVQITGAPNKDWFIVGKMKFNYVLNSQKFENQTADILMSVKNMNVHRAKLQQNPQPKDKPKIYHGMRGNFLGDWTQSGEDE